MKRALKYAGVVTVFGGAAVLGLFAAIIKMWNDADLDPEEFRAYDRGAIYTGGKVDRADAIRWSESDMGWHRDPKPMLPRAEPQIFVDPSEAQSVADIRERFGMPPNNIDELFELLRGDRDNPNRNGPPSIFPWSS